jgi:hypothetical protein
MKSGKHTRWTAEDDARMFAEYPHMRTQTLADAMGRSLDSVRTRAVFLDLRKTPEALHAINAARDQSASDAGRFGTRPPWNKGKRDEYRISHGAPLGAERLRDGYLSRKITLEGPYSRRWRFVHVMTWEGLHGPVPPGHMVTFKDGDRSNITPDNLALISNADNLARHSSQNYGPELFKLIQLRGQITRQLNKRMKRV